MITKALESSQQICEGKGLFPAHLVQMKFCSYFSFLWVGCCGHSLWPDNGCYYLGAVLPVTTLGVPGHRRPWCRLGPPLCEVPAALLGAWALPKQLRGFSKNAGHPWGAVRVGCLHSHLEAGGLHFQWSLAPPFPAETWHELQWTEH